jgi:hypothetical protein
MFNPNDFKNNSILQPIVEKLNKSLNKNKDTKISKILEQLIGLLDLKEQVVSVTYILSIIAENNFNYISETFINRLESLLDSDNNKVKINIIIILGFAMLTNQNYIDKYFDKFVNLIKDQNNDIKENVYYFLHEIIGNNPELIFPYKDLILELLLIEDKNENLLSLLGFFEMIKTYNFKDLYQFREISKSLYSKVGKEKNIPLYLKLVNLMKTTFPLIKDLNFNDVEPKQLFEIFKKHILIKRYNFNEISKKENLTLKNFMKKLKKSILEENEIYLYTKISEKDLIYVYEVEKEKLLDYFNKNSKISEAEVLNKISVFEDENEVRNFIKTLIKLNYIKGFISELGYFYPYNYLKSEFIHQLENKGIIHIKKFNYIHPNMIDEIINDIAISNKDDLLLSKSKKSYYSLKKIQKQINIEAAKRNSIDLKPFRKRLIDKDFIKLVKNLPKEYLTSFHKGTQWLTNLGLLKVKNEIESSKVIGFYSISELSKKLNISEILLIEIFDQYIDFRTGIFNRDKDKFYYSKFVNTKINEINLIPVLEERKEQIKLLSDDLDIDPNQILSKIDENLRDLGEEIKQKDQIDINDYLEKTGMLYNTFLKFISDLGLSYFKKGDILIFNESKINDAKNEIKLMLIEKSKSEDFISLGDLDITSNLVENLLKELQKNEKIKGIFYNDKGEIKFYTITGIKKLMLENSHLFSFHDFFYGKELNSNEIELLRAVFNSLLAEKKLKGSFDEETLTFSSHDVLFAEDYNSVLSDFDKIVKNYNQNFNNEFQKIKKILTKRNENIFPQEIKAVQEAIDRINEKYIRWRNGLESFVRNANVQLLKKQGYNMKRYRSIQFSADKKENIKLFEEDPEVRDLLNEFNSWIKLFNEIEMKYENIIFYQKRLMKDPDIKENQEKFNDLLNQLNLN